MKSNTLERRNKLIGQAAPLFYEQPLHLVKGEGVFLYDVDGNRYLDAYNNVPVVGHCHPKVVEALYQQASTLNIHTRYLDMKLIEYAERLTSTFDASLDMVIFTCTGSEANDVALRMARLLTGKKGIICSNSTYHGNTESVDELSTTFHHGQSTSPNVKAIPFPELYRPLNDLYGSALLDAYVHEVETAIQDFKNNGIGFAGMLVCPIFANEGLPSVPEGYMQKVAQIVRNAGGFLIFDEVQAGFGRTGKMWGQQMINVVPDLVTLGKPMGNGHPMGAVISRSELINNFRNRIMYFNTFGGNPVSCAVGLSVLNAIEEDNLLENVEITGQYLTQELHKLRQKHSVIGDVRGSGLFLGIELVSDRIKKTPEGELAKKIINKMKDRRVLIGKIGPYDNVLKIRPPLPFTQINADQLLSALSDCLEEI